MILDNLTVVWWYDCLWLQHLSGIRHGNPCWFWWMAQSTWSDPAAWYGSSLGVAQGVAQGSYRSTYRSHAPLSCLPESTNLVVIGLMEIYIVWCAVLIFYAQKKSWTKLMMGFDHIVNHVHFVSPNKLTFFVFSFFVNLSESWALQSLLVSNRSRSDKLMWFT